MLNKRPRTILYIVHVPDSSKASNSILCTKQGRSSEGKTIYEEEDNTSLLFNFYHNSNTSCEKKNIKQAPNNNILIANDDYKMLPSYQ